MSTSASQPRAQLGDVVHQGIAIDLYHVEQVLFLCEFIGGAADQINTAGFGQFFGDLQLILGRFLALQAARIFDRPTSRYPVRSIPAAITLLRTHSGSLAIAERPGLIGAMCRAGVRPGRMDGLSDPDLTRFVADFFDRRISDSHPEGQENARALLALKTVRDKRVAHAEAIAPDQLPRSTFADIHRLASLAKSFVGAVGIGYLSTAYEDDAGRYLMSSDAQRSTACLRRLLQRAGVVPESQSR